ncbi:Adenine phosphoribosyltransferase [Limihaloglobus sulfuriphilus]|uniref:Adenine phosphoribosyltransferase n=1 Tax=Limihaloglobus sulfuriphilus TaxID=1851148 RepID=A0A1Q2MAN5_9BACT|nr:adenine phosphoribosyltransferase [Limihaloglobus sulfuriphilus]AQQ69734.1 Adenine phosphoribosyltransferase [Limihaloglobus sulfuriphilus]
MNKNAELIKSVIADVPDFPVKGILFRDITPLLADNRLYRLASEMMAEPFRDRPIDYVACVESRGFIFGGLIAEHLGAGFIPIRKKGKLPRETVSEDYGLEYGKDTIEVHTDAFSKGKHVLIVDDLLATGGTVQAAAKLVERAGGVVSGMTFLIELSELNGKELISEYNYASVIKY